MALRQDHAVEAEAMADGDRWLEACRSSWNERLHAKLIFADRADGTCDVWLVGCLDDALADGKDGASMAWIELGERTEAFADRGREADVYELVDRDE